MFNAHEFFVFDLIKKANRLEVKAIKWISKPNPFFK